MNNRTKRVAFLGLAVSLALILSYVESLLPPLWAAVPGIKMGLANVVLVFLLYRFSWREAAVVSLVRVLLASMLFGTPMTMIYSLVGASVSLLLMALLRRTDRFSTVGVSVVGGVAHNLGQILTAMIILQTGQIGYYMLILTVTGTVAGVCVGLAGAMLLRYSDRLDKFLK